MNLIRKITNLVTTLNLSETSLDFLEIITNKKYDLTSEERITPVSIVNNSPFIQQMRKDHELELGLSEFFPLERKLKGNSQTLFNLFKERKSERQYRKVVSFKEFSNLLLTAYFQDDWRRNIASGGGMYPVELFFFNNRMKEIPIGLYYYNIYRNQVELIERFSTNQKEEFIEKTFIVSFKSDMEYENASAFIFPIALVNKASFKYGDLAVKLALIDGGAITQNIYLSSSTLKLKCCACAGFLDQELKRHIGFNRVYQHTITSILIGK